MSTHVIRQHLQIQQLLERNEELTDEIERLQAFMDKLPKTLDGVTKLPDDQVWHIDASRTIRVGIVFYNAGWGATVSWPSGNTSWPNRYDIEVERCYSTLEAAEAAKGE